MKYYSDDHRYIEGVNRVLDCPDTGSKDFSLAVGRMGWSGMGSFLDSVFCDLSRGKYEREEINAADLELIKLMYILGSHALKVDPSTPNHSAIHSMVEAWKEHIL
ncbi:MAG: hypothetical protein QNK36_20825 [Colwellia sp.]|nr:hypothetical protein [Colwellia sp.]